MLLDYSKQSESRFLSYANTNGDTLRRVWEIVHIAIYGNERVISSRKLAPLGQGASALFPLPRFA
jgi:hypothetical protein